MRAVGEHVAFLDRVELAELHRIHADGLGDARHVRLEAEVELRIAEAAVGAAGRHVGVDADRVDLDVGHAVGARGRKADGVHDVGAVFRRRAGVPVQGMLERDDLAGLLHAHLDAGDDALPLRGVHELLLAGPVELDGPALHRDGQHGGDDFHRHARLAAEAAADVGGHDANVLVRQAEGLQRDRHHAALGERRLRRRPERQAAGQVEQAGHGVGFDGAMRVARHGVDVFEDEIGLPEALFDVALAGLAPVGDVRARAREEPRHLLVAAEIGVDEHGILLQGVCEAQHGGQLFVVDLDQLGGAQGGLGGFGDDGGDLFADEADAVLGENIAVLHVEAEHVGEILAGHHADDAGGLFGRGNVDLLELGVGARAFHHHGVQQAGTEIEIVHVLRGARDLGQAVHADGRSADDAGFAHDRALREAVFFLADLRATSRTVATMGS